jgi:hypothetical protein
MLASSSENNDVPSRDSSLSSLSEKNQIINIERKKSIINDDTIEKITRKNHVKGSLLTSKRNNQNHFQDNSEN